MPAKVSVNAFVIMPFGDAFDRYYGDAFKPALEACGYSVRRADDFHQSVPILDDIRAQIRLADLLLCDMTDRNANVAYELGLAHAIGKRVILVAQSAKEIPFDLAHVRHIIYRPSKQGWEEEAAARIRAYAAESAAARTCWPPSLLPCGEGLIAYYPEGPSDGYRFVEDASDIWAAGYSLRGLLEVMIVLRTARKLRDANIRLLVADPDAGFVRQREVEEGIAGRRGQIEAEVRSTIGRARELNEEVPPRVEVERRVHVRLYRSLPYCALAGTEAVVRYMPYLVSGRAGVTPAFDFDATSRGGQRLRQHFERLWAAPDTRLAV